MNKKIKTSFLKLFFGIICCFIVINCSWAAGIPKYNPSDPNPKPGLYRVGDMNYEENIMFCISGLPDNRILFAGYSPDNSFHKNNAEIFVSSTGKFQTIIDTNYMPYKCALMDNGRVLLLGRSIRGLGLATHSCLEIYDPKSDKFIDTHICKNDRFFNSLGYKTNPSLSKLDNGKFTVYIREMYGIPYTQRYALYIYDSNNNTITDEPILEGEEGFVIPDVSSNDGTLPFSDAEYKTMKKNIEGRIGSFHHLVLNDERILIFARDLVDYDVRVDSIEDGKYKGKKSWFSPMYEYNIKTQILKPLYEYIPSAYSKGVSVNNNTYLIFYNSIPHEIHNTSFDSKKIPYGMRVNKTPDKTKRIKNTYFYIYK